MNNQIQDKYNKAKTHAKSAVTNPVYASNAMLAVAAVLVLLIYGGTIAFRADAFLTASWWLDIGCRSLAMCMLLVSMTNIYYERQRQIPSFVASTKILAGKVFCCNDNQDLGTYDGVMHEVNEFNRGECERVWRHKLRRAVGSLFGTELSKLNTSFDTFDSLTDEWWEDYIAKTGHDTKYCRKLTKSIREVKNARRRRKVMKVVRKIRNNEYKVPQLITVDAVLYDTFRDEETVSPVYKEATDIIKGVARRALGLVSFAAVFASVFFDKAPDLKGWIYAIVGCAFSIASTLFMSYSLAQKMAVKRRNALHKRLNLLEAAFNFCGLPLPVRARYYDMSHKMQTEDKKEDAVE